jgi:hypothetical protein
MSMNITKKILMTSLLIACSTIFSFSANIQSHHIASSISINTISLPSVQTVTLDLIPARAQNASSGSQFAKQIALLSDKERQHAALLELEAGNVPDFMRKLYPLPISFTRSDSTSVRGTIWVSPDYISIGSNNDFLRFPLAYFPAATIARLFGCILPTTKIVDTIYKYANIQLRPKPLCAGPNMRSCDYLVKHQKMVEEQLGYRFDGGIIAGQKKDVVLSNRLWTVKNRIAIYGWHKNNSTPIQPLSTVHGENYADYSHGIRLVRDSVLIMGSLRSVYDILSDNDLAPLLTYEGVMKSPAKLMGVGHNGV